MQIVDERRDAAIAKLGLSPAALEMTKGKNPFGRIFDNIVGPLHLVLGKELFSPMDLDVYPLWEAHDDVTAFHVKEDGTREFIYYNVEDMEDFTALGTTFHGVSAEILTKLWVEREVPEREIRNIAIALGFPVIEEFCAGLKTAIERDEDLDDWLARFSESIG